MGWTVRQTGRSRYPVLRGDPTGRSLWLTSAGTPGGSREVWHFSCYLDGYVFRTGEVGEVEEDVAAL